MLHRSISKRLIDFLIILIVVINTGSSAMAGNPQASQDLTGYPQTPVVAQIYYADAVDLSQLAAYLDIWEVNHQGNYLVALLSPEQYLSLIRSGHVLVIDQTRTDLLSQPRLALPGQGIDSIPGYPCYRTVEETYTSMQILQASYSYLVQLSDIGDSWDKVTAGGPDGYDIYAIRLTNETITPIESKPTFFIMAEIHAREYTTAETAMRFAEYLVNNYGTDPDITWLLDYFRVYIVPMTNPDGRKFAEQGQLWRKNTDSDDGCSDPSSWGTDLNRNHSFKWGGAGTSPCGETYQGPAAGSEPETQAIQTFIASLFVDQRGPADTDPAPVNTTGMFVTLHSYAQATIFPWGWTTTPAPNRTQLQTLGRKLGFFNQYEVCQSGLSSCMYNTTGTSDDWAYGNLGIAAYTIEMGNDFFESCSYFQNYTLPLNRSALLYAFKAARRPYMDPSGPDSLNLSLTPNNIPAGTLVQLTAIADDTGYDSNGWGSESTQNISAAHFSIDNPSWITGTVTYPMSAVDGSFNEKVEDIRAVIDTSDLSNGRHTLYVQSMDANGNWGVPSATFMNISPSAPQAIFSSDAPVTLGQPVNFLNQTVGSDPLAYYWDFGDGVGNSVDKNPAYTYTAPGVYTVTLVSTNTLGTASSTGLVTINPAVVSSVALTQTTPSPIIPGVPVSFSLELSPIIPNNPYTYTIDFSDSIITATSVLNPLNFDHIFNTLGVHSVQIWVQNAAMIQPLTDSLEVKVGYSFFLPISQRH